MPSSTRAGDTGSVESTRPKIIGAATVWLAISAGVAWIITRGDDCSSIPWRALFAGGAAEFDVAVALCTANEPPAAMWASGFALLLALAMIIAAPLLASIWTTSWRARPFRTWTWVSGVPVAAAAFALAAAVVLAIGVQEAPVLAIDPWSAQLTAALIWPAVILATATWVAVGVSILASLGSRDVPRSLEPGKKWTPDPIDGVGICVSGGGIRAAAFAVGALGYLEKHTLDSEANQGGALEHAKYLASVSGGGYTAGAWRIARGTADEPGSWPDGVFGDITADADAAAAAPHRAFDDTSSRPSTLFEHMWARREFLRTGPGGLGLSAIMFILSMALHLVILAAAVTLAAWPIGVIARSWPILGPEFHGDATYNFAVRWRSVVPILGALGIAPFVIIARSTMRRTRRRLRLDAMIGVVAFTAGLLTALLIVLPTVVAALSDLGALVGTVASAFAAGGVMMAAAKTVSSVLRPRLPRLGGVLFAVAALVFGAFVTRAAAVPGGWLDGRGGWYPLFALAFLAVWSYGDPRWWSLFPLYRNRLRNAFAVAPRGSANAPLVPLAGTSEPLLDEYRGAPGPDHLVCCAVARSHRTGTGIPALSFVFAPDEVRMYEPTPASTMSMHSVETEKFVRALRRRWSPAPTARPRALGTVSAAMAMSGAAVTSSMGKLNMGSTNALITALNVRLGAWVPNPRHVSVDPRPAKRARVNYLVKELFGYYDLEDPHVYVTDGGHWDNLGLVELLRRRCETIVCVDASGDSPGSFSTFHQALDLALIECDARVDFDEHDNLDAMRSDNPAQRPPTSSALATISYFNGESPSRFDGQGRLLYVKAQVSADLPRPLVAYSFEDPLFPSYSTADQFLGTEQFRMLSRLGWECTRLGVTKRKDWTCTGQ